MSVSLFSHHRAVAGVVLIAPLLQMAAQTPTSPPQCAGVSLSVESVRPADYEFRLTIRNRSSAAVVLGTSSRIDWDLARKTTWGWKPMGGGSARLWDAQARAAVDGSFTIIQHPDEVRIRASETYTGTFTRVDLWGDEQPDHPDGLYRVTFAITPDPTPEVRTPHCRLYAKPIVYQQASPAKRGELR